MKILIVAGPLFLMSCSISSPFMCDTTPSGPPTSNEAKVVFYRTDITGNAETFAVYADGQLVGYPERGRTFEVRCEPGEHLFSSPGAPFLSAWPSRADAVVQATLDPGKTYYIQAWASGGGWAGTWARLRPLTQESSRWAKIERKIIKLQFRELRSEVRGGSSEILPALKWSEPKNGNPVPEEPRLRPEDGR